MSDYFRVTIKLPRIQITDLQITTNEVSVYSCDNFFTALYSVYGSNRLMIAKRNGNKISCLFIQIILKTSKTYSKVH